MWTTHLLETTFNREGLYCKHGEIMVIFQFYLQNCSKGMADSSSSCDVVVIPPVNKAKLIMMIRCSSKPAFISENGRPQWFVLYVNDLYLFLVQAARCGYFCCWWNNIWGVTLCCSPKCQQFWNSFYPWWFCGSQFQEVNLSSILRDCSLSFYLPIAGSSEYLVQSITSWGGVC